MPRSTQRRRAAIVTVLAAVAALRVRSCDVALVLVHDPGAADLQSWSDYRGWMLAGHTHGGRCKPPFLPPPLLQNWRYALTVRDVCTRVS